MSVATKEQTNIFITHQSISICTHFIECLLFAVDDIVSFRSIFKLLDKKIKPVSVAKDLGVIIDSSLSYNEHVTKPVSDCMHRLISINRIKHFLDRKTLLLLINAFVFSKLFYCSTVWSNTSKTNIKKLQLVQNFAGRRVLGLRKYDHISEGLNSLRWLPMADKLLLQFLLWSLSA